MLYSAVKFFDNTIPQFSFLQVVYGRKLLYGGIFYKTPKTIIWRNILQDSLLRERVSCDVEKDSSESGGELDVEFERYKPPEKKVALASSSTKRSNHSSSSSSSGKMRSYKDNLLYDPAWKSKYPWMDYDSVMKGTVCIVCKAYGKVPAQARGAWVTQPVSNCVKATALFKKHEKSEWHVAAVEENLVSVITKAWRCCGTDCGS